MESLCRLFGILILLGFGFPDTSNARPIDGDRGPSGGGNDGGAEEAAAWLTGILGPSLLAAAALMAAGGAALVGCCACCRKSPKGFQEFTDSGSSHSLSTGGYVNPAASGSSPANEFTIFPPAASVPATGGGGPVSFEPLPDIKPRQTHGSPTSSVPCPSKASSASGASRRRSSQKKPAAFNNAVSHGLSAQDWFDDPHENFPRSQLKYLCEFGKGWFGRVVEGEALGLSDAISGVSSPTTPTRVIVKILHGDATPTDQMYFLHEVRYLKDLTPHPNILQLKGRCLETDPFLIMLEACPSGDLKTFLLQNLATSEALRLQGVILKMACNVAAGLQYMHERGFVHTDLAARNCLVASDLTVKIGDYGTSIENFKDDYYCADDVALPIRWCAPETLHCTDTTIETKEVTTSANMWSFGVLLWEVCEFGRLPYSELNDEEVIIKVLSEKSLHLGPPSRPCLHSNNLYNLMRICWNGGDKRPEIGQVASMLNKLCYHPEESPSRSFEDFERHWAATKPNGITAVVETIVHEPPFEMQQKTDEGQEKPGDLELVQRNLSPSPHPSLHGEPLSPNIKHKSPSLQNLRGSLEDLVECSCPNGDDANKETCSSVCELETASCDIELEGKGEASWLQEGELQGVAEDDEDEQFVRKISEAIRDLDDVLALEKTSSSSGSGTSPEEHSPTKKRFVHLSHEKIDENGVLDFRLVDKIDIEVASSENVICPDNRGGKDNADIPNVSTTQMDSLQWESESATGESDKQLAERYTSENENECTFNQNVINWKEGLSSEKVDLDTRTDKPKTAMEVAQEEEEEVWRQRVERGEFSAKVREKSRSVQDLMVLTHIEDSSEGSDSEGGVVQTGKSTSSPPPGPLFPCVNPSFGSVGDLRTAVLGEEFRHTLERLCAANKRGQSGSPVHSNLLEEHEDRKTIGVDEYKEETGGSVSSQNDECLEDKKETGDVPSLTTIVHSHLTESLVNSLPLLPSKDFTDATNVVPPSETSLEGSSGVTCNQDALSASTDQLDEIIADSSRTICSVMTSTPMVSSSKNNRLLNEDSFIFDSPPPHLSQPGECKLTEEFSPDSSVSSVDPTYAESENSLCKTIGLTSSNLPERENCDSYQSLNVSKTSLKDLDEPLRDVPSVVAITNASPRNVEICSKESSVMPVDPLELWENDKSALKTIVDAMESCTSDVESLRRAGVSPLSILAKQCLSSYQLQKIGEDNGRERFIGDTNGIENKGYDVGLSNIQKNNDDQSIDLGLMEKNPQDSPVSECPGEIDEQSPLHGLTCGISGSQSTVECRSPLALSPVTVGVEELMTPASATILSVSSQGQTLNISSPCEEKFKSDGVTKEINSDFIFTVDPSVENMDAVVKPDLLLDTEKVQKEITLEKIAVSSNVNGHSNINFQDKNLETRMTNTESEKNSEISWKRTDSISKGVESSHILLDLVQIGSSKIQNLPSETNILSVITEPIQIISTSNEEHINFPSFEFSTDAKDLKYARKALVNDNEKLAMDKDSHLSDMPNSEECDSAGTEDSVFDFSPPAPDSNNGMTGRDCHCSTSEEQTVFLPNSKEEMHVFSGGKSDYDSAEPKECRGPDDHAGFQNAEGRRDDEEDEELVLLGTKQWTPDDERSSDSGFRDKGSLSESVEDACERCDLADVETVAEEDEIDLGGGEANAEGDIERGGFGVHEFSSEINGEDYGNENQECQSENQHKTESSCISSPAVSSSEQDEFWRQQMASLRQAAGETATLLREASTPVERSSWIEGEAWDEDVMGSSEELKMLTEGSDSDRGLDEASLAALRIELQEKLGGSNSRFGVSVEGNHGDGPFERANSEEHLSEEEDDGEETNEERTDITIHYDAYLAQLSPILEERESVGSSEMYSPATKEPPRDSISDDSATTASVNDIGDNHVFSSESNAKDPAFTAEDVLVVDTSTNQASFLISSPVDFRENDATSPEFSDSLEDDDNDDNDMQDKTNKCSPKDHLESEGGNVLQKSVNPTVRYAIPPSDLWTSIPSLHSWNGINNMKSSGDGSHPSPPRSPLLLPPPPSSAPMPSPEEERAGCVERSGAKNMPIFRDFEDIVALCQKQGDDFSTCNETTMEGFRGDSQRSSEETEISSTGVTTNLPFWESESSDGNDSSSSGEFVWKEGERDIPQAAEAPAIEPVSRVYESMSEFPMAVIEEEDEDEAGDGEGDKEDGASDSSGSVTDFIPSVWNSAAEPSHSSLRSPDRKSDQKKNVSFKRQKYHCVYEYPKEEASDSESECQDSPTRRRWEVQQIPPFDYSSYADWELMEGDIPEGIIPGEIEVESEVPNAAANHRQFDFYKLSSEDYDFGFAVSPEVAEGEFMVSSSSRPFQYCTTDSTFAVGSQFFPGCMAACNVPGWVASRRSSSKNGEENIGLNESNVEEANVGDNVPELIGESVAQDSSNGEVVCTEKVSKPVDGTSLEWSPQHPLPSPVHSSSSSASLSSCSPPASPLSPTGLGELRHTRDRLKLDLPHKFSLSDVSHGKGLRKDTKTTGDATLKTIGETKELKLKRKTEEERGEASLLDIEKEREGITKTAL